MAGSSIQMPGKGSIGVSIRWTTLTWTGLASELNDLFTKENFVHVQTVGAAGSKNREHTSVFRRAKETG